MDQQERSELEAKFSKLQDALLEAGKELARARADYELAKIDTLVAAARAEAKVIKEAGGVKGLGSNQADRDRELRLGLAKDSSYMAALEGENNLLFHYEVSKTQKEIVQNAIRFLIELIKSSS